MSRIRRAGFFLPGVSLLVLLVVACSSGDSSPTAAPATAIPDTPAPTLIVVDLFDAMSGELDVSGLPDDPTELMMPTLDVTLDRVARKMAYSLNQTYIPVLLEFLRFQVQPEAIINVTSFLSRLKDGVPPMELMIYDPEQNKWKWWIEWLGNNPQVQPPDGYIGWKSQLYSIVDPGLGAFLYDGVKTETLWHQFRGVPAVGPLAGSGMELEVLPMTLTVWSQWVAEHPDTTVLDLDT